MSEKFEETSVESDGEFNEETSEVETPESEPAPAPQTVRKLRLKVDGEEFEEELPFDIPKEQEEYLKKQLQLAKVSQKRMQAAAEKERHIKQMEGDIRDFLLELKENPIKVLSDPNLSVDLKAIAQTIMNQELEDAAKTPEQKEREELEKRLKTLEEEKSRIERESRERELKVEEDKIATQIEQEITEAISANNLPNDPEVVGLIAKNLKIAMKFNLALTAKDVIPVVKRELYEKAKLRLSLLSDEELFDFVGEERFNNIRKNMIKSLKQQLPPSARQIKDGGSKNSELNTDDIFTKKGKKGVRSRDFFKDPLKFANNK